MLKGQSKRVLLVGNVFLLKLGGVEKIKNNSVGIKFFSTPRPSSEKTI
jgi:hypothetical protein